MPWADECGEEQDAVVWCRVRRPSATCGEHDFFHSVLVCKMKIVIVTSCAHKLLSGCVPLHDWCVVLVVLVAVGV
jgi:hypothetical protein